MAKKLPMFQVRKRSDVRLRVLGRRRLGQLGQRPKHPGDVREVVQHGRLEQVGLLRDAEGLRACLQKHFDVLQTEELGQLRPLVESSGMIRRLGLGTEASGLLSIRRNATILFTGISFLIDLTLR